MATWSAIAATTNALETLFRNAAAASGETALKNYLQGERRIYR